MRLEPKGFFQRRPDSDGGWIHNLDGVDPLPYRLPDLVTSGERIIVCEGEKDVDTLLGLGFPATCNHGGAGKWTDAHSGWLVGREVVIIPDNDRAGLDHARQVAFSLWEIAETIRLLDPLPGLAEKGDVSDWFDQGGTADALLELIESTPPWTPGPVAASPAIAPPLLSLDPAALHGLAGDLVRAFEPCTEADPAALLATFLVAFGNAAGPGPHTYVGERRHGVNLSVVICGATSRSRKGTSWSPVELIMEGADPEWLREREADGIGSGEAIIWAVRDPSEPKIDPKTGATVIDDIGVEDKRLMIQEEEFSGFLKVTARDGSIAGEIFRKAWDGKRVLRNIVKRSPVVATGAHISFVGHITVPELRRTLTETDQANGVGNRVLWVHAQRSKLLADAPRLDERVVAELVERTRSALAVARQGRVINRDAEAAMLWRERYPQLSQDHPGLYGALTARAEAQVLRLSMIYALLDCSTLVRREHLDAACAFWAYCQESVRYIFGDTTGDPVADRILNGLRGGEMTETALNSLFGGHQKRDRIQGALRELQRQGLVEQRREETGRKPIAWWRAAGETR